MLLLSRKPGERILIGEHVEVTVVRTLKNRVLLAVQAPRTVDVWRHELRPPANTSLTPLPIVTMDNTQV
jgi:carbon storage regulator